MYLLFIYIVIYVLIILLLTIIIVVVTCIIIYSHSVALFGCYNCYYMLLYINLQESAISRLDSFY